MQQCKQGTDCTRNSSSEKGTQMLVDDKLNVCQQGILIAMKAEYLPVLKRA